MNTLKNRLVILALVILGIILGFLVWSPAGFATHVSVLIWLVWKVIRRRLVLKKPWKLLVRLLFQGIIPGLIPGVVLGWFVASAIWPNGLDTGLGRFVKTIYPPVLGDDLNLRYGLAGLVLGGALGLWQISLKTPQIVIIGGLLGTYTGFIFAISYYTNIDSPLANASFALVLPTVYFWLAPGLFWFVLGTIAGANFPPRVDKTAR